MGGVKVIVHHGVHAVTLHSDTAIEKGFGGHGLHAAEVHFIQFRHVGAQEGGGTGSRSIGTRGSVYHFTGLAGENIVRLGHLHRLEVRWSEFQSTEFFAVHHLSGHLRMDDR